MAKERLDPLSCIPPSKVVREELKAVQERAVKYAELLRITEQLEKAASESKEAQP